MAIQPLTGTCVFISLVNVVFIFYAHNKAHGRRFVKNIFAIV